MSEELFNGLDPATRADLRAQLRTRSVPAGGVVCSAGDGSDSLYLIERGLLNVLDSGGALLGPQHPGDVVGEVALLTGEPRSATLVARVPSEVSELPRDAFFALTARHPVLLANLAAILGRRLVARTATPRGEVTALLTGPGGWAGTATALATAEAASATPVTVVDAADPRSGTAAGRRCLT